MTNVQARAALIGEIAAIWSASPFAAVPLYWIGGPEPDVDAGDRYAVASVVFDAAVQASIERHPLTRVSGIARITAFKKLPGGDLATHEMVEYVSAAMAHRSVGELQTTTPRPLGDEAHDGWYSSTWGIPFWFHKPFSA